MKFLNRLKVEEFLHQQGRSNRPADLDVELSKFDEYCINFTLPESPGKTLAAIRYLFEEKIQCSWILIIIESSGIWPSWQDTNLYGMMRTARGGANDWLYGEGHLFDPSENLDIISFVTVFSNFRWNFRVIDSTKNFNLSVSHDDHGKLFKANLTKEFNETFSKFFI